MSAEATGTAEPTARVEIERLVDTLRPINSAESDLLWQIYLELQRPW